MDRNRRALGVLLVALLIAALAACSDSKTATPKQPPEPFRIGIKRLPTLDPAQASSEEQRLVAEQLFDSLTKYDDKGTHAGPSIAASWNASPDLKDWDFVIDPTEKFSNQKPITANDVKYTLDRIVRMGSTSPVGDLLQDVAGFTEAGPSGTADGLSGVTVVAADRVHITLTKPLAELPELLANPSFGIVSAEAVDKAPPTAFADVPVTSGPFRLESRVGDVLTLRIAPGPIAAGKRGQASDVRIVQYSDDNEIQAGLKQGVLDWAKLPADAVASDLPVYKIAQSPYLASLFYAFNLKSPKFSDARFREAIIHAIDRKAVLDVMKKTSFRQLDGVVVQGLFDSENIACGPVCSFDPDRSKLMLAELFGQNAPPSIRLDYDADPTQAAVSKVIQSYLANVGIQAELHEIPADQYGAFSVSGQQEVFRFGWVAGYSSPGAFLRPLFSTGSDSNASGFSDASVDAKLDAARLEADPSRRQDIYADVERSVMAQAPLIPIAQAEFRYAASKRSRNIRIKPDGTFDASVVTVDARP